MGVFAKPFVGGVWATLCPRCSDELRGAVSWQGRVQKRTWLLGGVHGVGSWVSMMFLVEHVDIPRTTRKWLQQGAGVLGVSAFVFGVGESKV